MPEITREGRPRKPARQAGDPQNRDEALCVCSAHPEPHHHCWGCGFAIAVTESWCGECLCEDDSDG